MQSKELVQFLEWKVSDLLTKRDISIEHAIFICREDGVFLFKENDQNISQELGALVAGMWQAAKSLGAMATTEIEEYMLQFSTSNSGVFLYPLFFQEETLILGTLFTQEVNPGKLKNRIRNLRDSLLHSLEEESILWKKSSQDNSPDKFLFANITDREIDNLFAFVGT